MHNKITIKIARFELNQIKFWKSEKTVHARLGRKLASFRTNCSWNHYSILT